MQTLLLSDNTRYGRFIQKGLQSEHLPVELQLIDPDMLLPVETGVTTTESPPLPLPELFSYDAVFLLFRSFPFLQQTAEILRNYKKKMLIFALADELSPDLQRLSDTKCIDLFFTRPFPFRAITSEMKFAIFQMKEHTEQSLYVFRDLELNTATHTVHYKGIPVPLRNKEFFLLHFLMSNPGKVLSRATILEHVWDRNANILTNTVDVHVSNLRRKISRRTGETFIRTVPCAGYIFS